MPITVDVRNVTKIYRTLHKTGKWWRDLLMHEHRYQTAIDNLSLTVHEGELIGLVGPNGAGKTTLMKMLAGILLPTSGSIAVIGYDPFDKSPRFLRTISFVMGQRNQLIWDLPARDSFELNRVIYDIAWNDYRTRLRELCGLLACSDLLDQPLKTVSLGQRMRLELVGALLHEPRVLFLDEPTLGLDVVASAAIREFLRTYQQRYRPTILFTSHYMRDVSELADRLLLMDRGVIRYDGTVRHLQQHFSAYKTIQLELRRQLTQAEKARLKVYEYTYTFPLLSVTIPADTIVPAMSKLVQHLPYYDMTVSDRSIEDIMRSAFQEGGAVLK